MKRILILTLALMLTAGLFAQQTEVQSSADRMLTQDGKLNIGGYGQIDYNQSLSADNYNLGTLDVHRLILLFGYNFSDKTKFVTEIEMEHVKELYVEQAFLQHEINDFMNFRAGLMLIPMGIINEYHEPTTFNGVERPHIDKYIAPTTWREVGAGLSGNIIGASLKYQAYLVNGFNGYDGSGTLNGTNGLRKGRQKGADSYIHTPNFTARAHYYGISNLQIGLSTYLGKTQSVLYDKLDKANDTLKQIADSSIVGVNMFGVDAKFAKAGWEFRGQFYLTNITNTIEYNYTTGTQAAPNDLGSQMMGYYVEAAYNVFHSTDIESQLIPFVRYEAFNTQQKVESGIIANKANSKTIITSGLGWKIHPGAMLKADIQFVKSEADTDYSKGFNAGVAIMF